MRTPLGGILDKVMSLKSLGKFDGIKAENNYTDYYHLFLVVRLSDGVFCSHRRIKQLHGKSYEFYPKWKRVWMCFRGKI